MSKIIKIYFKHGFTPVDKRAFKVGTQIDFDCYIQRFNGYAIIIKAGTMLDKKLYNKITNNKLQIFVGNEDYSKYKGYAIEYKNIENIKTTEEKNLNLEEEIEKSLKIENILSKETLSNEKLKHIYIQAKNLINTWLAEKENQKLPIEAFECLADNIVVIVFENKTTLSNLSELLDEKYTLATHLLNVALFTSLIANKLDIALDEKKKLVLSALLHDIGTTKIDESLLEKPDFLTNKEFNLVKKHALESVNIVRNSGLNDRFVLDAIMHHHERLDGSGYPEGLSKKRISSFAQILAVSDVFDALITNKPYRGAYSTFNALKLMKKEHKNRLNMKIVKIFIKLLD